MENSLIKDIGRSYIVSSLLPAVLFISIGLLIFRGFIPGILFQRIINEDEFYIAQWILFSTFVFWVGFCLYSATDWTVRIYEGYYLPEFIKKPMAKSLAQWRYQETENIRKAIEYKQRAALNPREYVDEYFTAAQTQYENVERVTNVENESVLPTRFGNILLASELYPQEKYNINGLSLWTRLMHVVPSNFKDAMEEKNNQMIFLLNSSLLSFIIGFLGLFIELIELPCQIFWDASVCSAYKSFKVSIFGPQVMLQGNAFNYLTVFVLFFVFGCVIYKFALPAAEGFGMIIRSGFDLYRFELLRQMNYPIPTTLEDEKTLWKEISEYMVAGNRLSWTPITFDYALKEELQNKTELNDKSTKSLILPPRIIRKSRSETPRLGHRIRGASNVTLNLFVNRKKKK